MADTITVEELLTEIREQADETNPLGAVTDPAILRVLNRASRITNHILALHYPEPLLKKVTLDLSIGAEHPIPDDCFGDMVSYVEIRTTGHPTETRRRMYRDSTLLETQSSVPVPENWTVEGRILRFLQAPTGAYDARLWYIRRIEKLVIPQGRVTAIGANYVIVDELGTGISSSSDSLDSYLNIINGSTGEVRGSFQVSSIVGGKITLRATALRALVKGRAISNSAALATSGVLADDYICLAEGTCIPFFQDVLSNYLVQYCVSEVTRSSGGEATFEKQLLDWVAKQVESAWAGREATARVKSRTSIWNPRNRF